MFRTVLILLALSAVLVKSNPDRDARIVGGRNVLPGEMPHMVLLRFAGANIPFAGGTLLSTRWVVTIASPLASRPANSISIVLGTTMINAGGTLRTSDTIRIHEQYNPITQANDIACVRFSIVLTFTQFINIIPLSATFIGAGVNAQVAGWGATNTNKGPDSNFLQVATVTTAACVNNEFFTFTPQHLCAGASTTGTPPPPSSVGICTIDIGGPLVLNNELIGIAAWHNPTGCGISLDGYLRISSYRLWILGVIT